ncbi:MAG: hypothetical protein RMZ69_05810 [Nostoc sp. ChiQUE01a]|nr:hypothetical protein [Nostoc sp. ChiQUE01a]
MNNQEIKQKAFENVTGNISVNNFSQTVNFNLTKPNSQITSFCMLLKWIYEKSNFSTLEDLPACYSYKILEIIQKNIYQGEGELLDFTELEINIFSLVFNFCHYYLQGGKPRLEKYNNFQEKDYYNYMKNLIDTEEKIRVCSVKLSSLIAHTKMSKLVEEVEIKNDF